MKRTFFDRNLKLSHPRLLKLFKGGIILLSLTLSIVLAVPTATHTLPSPSRIVPTQEVGTILVGQAVSNGKIAFVSNRDGNNEIYTMNADGSGQTRLTISTASDLSPAWSPDGSKIAFASNRDSGTLATDIYVMNADGTGQTRLTVNPADDITPVWSPDGSKIAFSTSRDGNYEIYTMNADGTGATRLTSNAASDASPTWSHDGTKIAFERGAFTTGGQIYVLDADSCHECIGTGPTNLSQSASSNTAPDWSPDGTKIVFASNRDGNYEIYIINPDGTGVTRVTSNTVSDTEPSWQPIRPPPSDFHVAADPSSLTVQAGNPGTSTITVTSINSFAGIVALASSVSPSGLICNLTPPSVTGSGTSTLSCSSPIAGNFVVTVTGTSGSLSHSATVSYSVVVQDFSVTASPIAVPVNAGVTGTSTITVAPINGFTGTVTLASTVSPAGLTCSLSPSSIVLGASQTSTLSCIDSSGVYTVTVTGTSGSLTHFATVTVTVKDYTVTGSPTSVAVLAGAAASSTITVAPLNGFTGTVALTQNGGSPCSLSQASVLLTSSTTSDYVTLSCTYPTASINTVTVTGTSGSLSHPVTVSFNVQSVTTIGCGTGCSVSISSDATISNVVVSSTSISFTAVSQGGATVFANVTISKSSVPNLSALQVSLDGTPITPSIASSSTDYFIYFTFAASNPAPIEIRFAPAAPENASALILGLPPAIFTAIVGAVATVVSAIIGLAYRSKSRTKN